MLGFVTWTGVVTWVTTGVGVGFTIATAGLCVTGAAWVTAGFSVSGAGLGFAGVVATAWVVAGVGRFALVVPAGPVVPVFAVVPVELVAPVGVVGVRGGGVVTGGADGLLGGGITWTWVANAVLGAAALSEPVGGW